MAWSNKQKQLAVRACKAAGITEDQRVDMILRNFKNAHYQGGISSTSPALTGHDFEAFMAVVERFAGGQVLHFTRDFWQRQSGDHLKRIRFRIRQLVAQLESSGLLAANGVGLSGWISKRVSGTASTIEELDYHGLQVLLIGLEAYQRGKQVIEVANDQ
jgi:hypothetical protein